MNVVLALASLNWNPPVSDVGLGERTTQQVWQRQVQPLIIVEVNSAVEGVAQMLITVERTAKRIALLFAQSGWRSHQTQKPERVTPWGSHITHTAKVCRFASMKAKTSSFVRGQA